MTSKGSLNFCLVCRKFQRSSTVKCGSNHTVCSACANSKRDKGPICQKPISQASQANSPPAKELTKVKCQYSMRGCKWLMEPPDLESHLAECRFRDFKCEGNDFCWSCPWTGRYDQIQEHFLEEHNECTLMLFKTEAKLQLDLSEEYSSISLIDFHDGQNFFWFKCKVDQLNRKFYSAVQMIGTRQQAGKYFYEFEIFKGPIKKIKVTEICDSDATNVESIFRNESCVAVSFETLKNYLDEDGSMMFRFRIMSYKKQPSEVST